MVTFDLGIIPCFGYPCSQAPGSEASENGGRGGLGSVDFFTSVYVQVRRDNCPLVVNLINTCLHKLLIDR